MWNFFKKEKYSIGDLIEFIDRSHGNPIIYDDRDLTTGLIIDLINVKELYFQLMNKGDRARAALFAGEAIGTNYKKESRIPKYYEVLTHGKVQYLTKTQIIRKIC